MQRPTSNRAWRVGDRALIERYKAAPFEGTVTGLLRITSDDAEKIRIKYPSAQGGDLVLVIADEAGQPYHFLSSDPAVKRVISTVAPTPGGA